MRKVTGMVSIFSVLVFGHVNGLSAGEPDLMGYKSCVAAMDHSVGYQTFWKKSWKLKDERIRAKGSVNVDNLLFEVDKLKYAPSPFTDETLYAGMHQVRYGFTSWTHSKKETRPCTPKVSVAGETVVPRKCSPWVKYDNPWGANHPTGYIEITMTAPDAGSAALNVKYVAETYAKNRPNDFIKKFVLPGLKDKAVLCIKQNFPNLVSIKVN